MTEIGLQQMYKYLLIKDGSVKRDVRILEFQLRKAGRHLFRSVQRCSYRAQLHDETNEDYQLDVRTQARSRDTRTRSLSHPYY